MISPALAFEGVNRSAEARWWQPAVALPTRETERETAVLKACVLGVDLVLWCSQHQWHAALDQCPHRGAALSKGCVVENALQCPYHGWRFDAQGACSLIPAVPDFKPPASHGLHTVGVLVYAGLLWVQLCSDPVATEPAALYPSHSDALAQTGMLHVLTPAYEAATSAPRVVENFLDVSHFGTVHEGWLGDAAHMAVPPYRVEASADRAVALGIQTWQPNSQTTATQGAWVDYRYEVAHPYCAILTKLPHITGGLSESIALWAVPVSPTCTRLWFSLCMADVGQGAAAVAAFQHTIFLQDAPVLESQRPQLLPIDAGVEKHSGADRMSAAYRQLLRSWRIGYGTYAN